MPRHGMTFIELIIAIALTAIVGLPIGMVLAELLQGGLRARDVTVAMNLARYELERLDSLRAASSSGDACVAELSVGSVTLPSYQGYPYDVIRSITCQTSPASSCTSCTNLTVNGVKRIEITVRRPGATQVLATLVTYRAKYVRFGPYPQP